MRRIQAKIPEQLPLACLGALAIFVAGLLLFKTFRPAAPPGVLLEQALQKLEGQERYHLLIEEHAPGYRLQLKGEVQNGTEIRGEIIDHCLEVFSRGEELYVRSAGEKEWQSAEELHLGSLASFVTAPAEVLRAQQENFPRFETVPGSEGETGHKIRFETDYPGKEFTEHLFPQIPPEAIHMLTVEAVLSAPGLQLTEIEIGLEFQDRSDGNLIRLYSLH